MRAPHPSIYIRFCPRIFLNNPNGIFHIRYSYLIVAMSLALTYSAFLPGAPILLMLSCILSYLFARTLIARSTGRGSNNRGPSGRAVSRLAGSVSRWLALGVIFHVLVTLNGYMSWPHDVFCPAHHEGIFLSDASLNLLSSTIFFFSLIIF